jgi:hypothetical protein
MLQVIIFFLIYIDHFLKKLMTEIKWCPVNAVILFLSYSLHLLSRSYFIVWLRCAHSWLLSCLWCAVLASADSVHGSIYQLLMSASSLLGCGDKTSSANGEYFHSSIWLPLIQNVIHKSFGNSYMSSYYLQSIFCGTLPRDVQSTGHQPSRMSVLWECSLYRVCAILFFQCSSNATL